MVGRLAPADVAIDDAGVSRQHARFVYAGGQLWVEDLDSRNGTLRDGKRLPAQQSAMVYPGDELLIGSVIASIEVRPGAGGVLAPMTVDTLLPFVRAEVARAEHTGTSVGVFTLRSLAAQPSVVSLLERLRSVLRPLDRVCPLPDGRLRLICPGCDLGRAETLAHGLVAQVAPLGLGVGVSLVKRSADVEQALAESGAACSRSSWSQPTVIAMRLGRRRIRRLWARSLNLVPWRRGQTAVTADPGLPQERLLLSAVMTICGQDEVRAAALLRIPPPTLSDKLQGWWVGATGPRRRSEPELLPPEHGSSLQS